MKPKVISSHFRDYTSKGGRYTKQGICPVCRQVRYVRGGELLPHYHSLNYLPASGAVSEACAGAGQKALGVEPLYLYYELSKL